MSSRIYPGNFNSPHKNFELDVIRGNWAGYEVVHKFGTTGNVLATPVTVWEGADLGATTALYTYSTSAAIDTLSSDNAADTGIDIQVDGLDANWAPVTQTVTLNGQTQVTLQTPLIRVYRLKNISATELTGIVYCYENVTATGGVPDDQTKIRAGITPGNNQSLMAVYTVPAGYTAYLYNMNFWPAKRLAAIIEFEVYRREFGGVFQKKHVASLNTQGGTMSLRYIFPEIFPEKTDIEVRAATDSTGVGAAAIFELLLIRNGV